MPNDKAGVHPLFFARGDVRFGHPPCLAAFNELGKGRVCFRGDLGNGMLRRNRHKGDAHDGVGPRGEDVDTAFVNEFAIGRADVVLKGKPNPFGAADPIFLHELHPLRPAQSIKVF